MKYTKKFFVATALVATFLISSVRAEERRGVINPITPKSLRKDGESKRDMIKRLFEMHEQRDVFERRKAAQARRTELMNQFGEALSKGEKGNKSSSKEKERKYFKNFEGYWLLDSIDDWSSFTLIEFFYDRCNGPMAKFYDGTQNHIREANQNDINFERVNPTPTGKVIPVEVLGPRSLRLLNTGQVSLSKDDRTSTFRIQDEDNDVAFAILWTNWDGTGDSSDYGIIENLSQFRRLPERPEIQLNRLPSETDWSNPVEMLKYIAEYYALLGQPQKAVELHQVDYIGWAGYQELLQTMLTTGVTRTAKSSTTYRGGQYIGVWRTQFPEDFPITTIHTQELHQFTACSTIEISGFTGAYAVLNGVHHAAAFPPSTVSSSTPYPWQECSSREHFIHILFDSSGIEEEYDPNIHGVATLTAHHGPVTPDIGYRDFMAAVLDFVTTSFGPGTHTRLAIWRDTGITVPETFEELKEAAANDEVRLTQVRLRTYGDNGFAVYWNPYVLGSPLAFPSFNLNDPFGLGLVELDPYFDYDIPRQNYLEEGTVKNIFFTITGAVDPEQPITGLLSDIGYTSNGSKVVYTAHDFQTFPEPLVDEFGTHDWMLYNWAVSTSETGIDQFSSQGFFGGIVRKDLTGDKTVAYLRILNEDGIDAPFYEIVTRSLAFPQEGLSSTYFANWTAAWASLIEVLNEYSPDRYIIDIRKNGGGFVINDGFGALVGGNRPSGSPALAFPGNGERNPVIIDGSGIQTVFDSVPKTESIIKADEAAAAFPNGVIRGSEGNKKEVIILTSTRSASSGDVLPHKFLGPDPEGTVQDLGEHVELRIVGDIDGRLWSGFKGFDPLPIDPLGPSLVNASGNPITATYLVADAGLLDRDRHGYFVNETLATRPNPLLPGWYDQTEWQDIGVTPNLVPYPLGNLLPDPDFNDRSSWRDVWLENAIKN